MSVPVVLFSNRRVLSILSKRLKGDLQPCYIRKFYKRKKNTDVEAFYDIYGYSYLNSCLCYKFIYT